MRTDIRPVQTYAETDTMTHTSHTYLQCLNIRWAPSMQRCYLRKICRRVRLCRVRPQPAGKVGTCSVTYRSPHHYWPWLRRTVHASLPGSRAYVLRIHPGRRVILIEGFSPRHTCGRGAIRQRIDPRGQLLGAPR